MYNISSGYYYGGSSLSQKKSKPRMIGRIRMLQLTMFLTLLTLSFVFGAVMHAYATNETPLITTVTQLTSPALHSPPLHKTHIVDAGQSLWIIAKQYMPASMDIRKYVNEIIDLNQLDTNTLFVGQRLLLPTI